MTLDNKFETQKTINYLRTVADMLEKVEYYLENISLSAHNIDWRIEREEINIQLLKAVDNG